MLLFGRVVGQRGSFILIYIYFPIALLFTLIMFIEVSLYHSFCIVNLLFDWFRIELLRINWVFWFDSVSVTMMLVVVFISFLVHLYSIEYMAEDPHLIRFLSYLSLFTFFMLILLSAGNFIQLFLGWEGVGLSSYLLINFWSQRIQANKSAFKAMVINRIGDWGLAFGFSMVFFFFKSLDFSVIFCLSPFFLEHTLYFAGLNLPIHEIICFFLFLGVVGKSAQFGLHAWLPDAMEGPTPVSALIHAATMVTAGIFLLVRCSPLFEYATFCLCFVSIIGALTALFGATVACFQEDLKKIIAYSTCSQLGYMVLACGLSLYSTGLFHFFNHAFFKALLFLSAGAVIHALLGEQSNDLFTNFDVSFNFTEQMFFIGSAALSSVCFLTGFYSKDWLLEVSNSFFYIDGILVTFLAFLAAIYTGYYTGLSFVGYREEEEEEELSVNFLSFERSDFFLKEGVSLSVYSQVAETRSFIFIVLVILALLSVVCGFIFFDFFLGIGGTAWEGAIFVLPEHFMFFEVEFLPFYWKLAPLALGVGVLFPVFSKPLLSDWKPVFNLFEDFFILNWVWDELSNYIYINFIFNYFYTVFFIIIDRGLLEILGPTGLIKGFSSLFFKFSSIQSGFLYHYAFYLVLGVSLVFGVFNLILFGLGLEYILIFLLFFIFFILC